MGEVGLLWTAEGGYIWRGLDGGKEEGLHFSLRVASACWAKRLPKAAHGPILFSAAALLSHAAHPPANGISLCGTVTLGGRHVSGVLVTLPGDPGLPSADPGSDRECCRPPALPLELPLEPPLWFLTWTGKGLWDWLSLFIPQQWMSSPPLPLGPSDSLRPRAPPFLQFPRPSDKLRSGSEPLRHDLPPRAALFFVWHKYKLCISIWVSLYFFPDLESTCLHWLHPNLSALQPWPRPDMLAGLWQRAYEEPWACGQLGCPWSAFLLIQSWPLCALRSLSGFLSSLPAFQGLASLPGPTLPEGRVVYWYGRRNGCDFRADSEGSARAFLNCSRRG